MRLSIEKKTDVSEEKWDIKKKLWNLTNEIFEVWKSVFSKKEIHQSVIEFLLLREEIGR